MPALDDAGGAVLRAGMRPYDICVRYAGNEFIAAVFRHDGDTCETLLANADSRMYRDKTRRKRQPGRGPSDVQKRPENTSLTEGDVQRSAVGIL